MAASFTRPASGDESPGFWVRPAWWNLSLYVRVVLVNSSVLLLAVLALVVTPATVSFPIATEQGLVLGGGALVIAIANAVLLRLTFSGLKAVVHRMETIDVLKPEDLLAVKGGPEAKTLIIGFNTMLDRLQTERRTSAQRTLSAIEGERRRIGRELHDEIGQRLTGTLLQLQRLADDLPEPLKAEVRCIQEQQRSTMDDVGALAWQLRPALLDDLGLLSAVEALAESMSEPAVEVDTSLPEQLTALPPDLELVVYRIAQEALTNAARHADASAVELSLQKVGPYVVLEVRDDGRGFAGLAEGSGLMGMRERAALVRADLSVISQPRHGTTVRLRVPVATEEVA